MQYCIYLRKSRKDMEAEAHGEGETLARHERLLLELAKHGGYNVTQIYREVVSGETIAARPVMQKLLQEVEEGIWSGVLVVEVERLARGDTIDQGIMAQTFKYSGTKIITPMKVYDPDNEFDEEYFEFGLFMSRREYKTINRRLQRGRIASAKEGKFIGSSVPFGYEKVRLENEKGFTLRPVESKAAIVRLIFELYVNGEVGENNEVRQFGTYSIALRLDEMGVPSPSYATVWNDSTVRRILSNPVYIGKIRWRYNKSAKQVVDGSVRKVIVKSNPDERILADGRHAPIISEELFQKAQELLSQNGPPPVPSKSLVANPLAGILVCGKCGRSMVLIKSSRCQSLTCSNRACDNISSYYSVVEEKLLEELSDMLNSYRLRYSESGGEKDEQLIETKRKAIQTAGGELQTLKHQLARTHDLLEQGVYDTETFLSRSRSLTERITTMETNLEGLASELTEDVKRAASRKNIIPKVEKLLAVYNELPNPKAKNDVLKAVIEKVEYTKDKKGHKGEPLDNFRLVVFPKLPIE